jgi:predicted 3-demethylubiquinone-9 3-methyltransferase (glyoxalase superfamily)
MQTITPFLWFNDNAEEAVAFYTSLFRNSMITKVVRYGEGGPAAGSVMTIAFELEGRPFVALNGGPVYAFSPAISFVVDCESQEEIDRYWDALAADGQLQQCGWLTDRFGVTWQIVPSAIGDWLGDPDPERSRNTAAAMMTMIKLDIAELRKAWEGA